MMKSGVYPLSLDVLDDGDAKRQFNEQLDEMLQDVVDRPHNRQPRTITLKVQVKPEIDESTKRNFPKVQCEVKSQKPGHVGRESTAYIDGGEVKINVHDLHGDDPSQPTIMNMAEDKPAGEGR